MRGMAERVKLTDAGPVCPRCGSGQVRRKSALEWGRAPMACVGCGVGLLPATRSQVRAHRRDTAAPPPRAGWSRGGRGHEHTWAETTTPDDARNGVRVYECACGRGRTEPA